MSSAYDLLIRDLERYSTANRRFWPADTVEKIANAFADSAADSPEDLSFELVDGSSLACSVETAEAFALLFTGCGDYPSRLRAWEQVYSPTAPATIPRFIHRQDASGVEHVHGHAGLLDTVGVSIEVDGRLREILTVGAAYQEAGGWVRDVTLAPLRAWED